MNYALFAINIAIGIWLVNLIRKQDIYDPEPFHKMAWATILGGGSAISFTMGAVIILQYFGLYQEANTLNFFVFTGPIEESSKLLGFLFFVKIFDVRFDEPIDSVIYMSCVALGFSLVENLTYAMGVSPLLLGLRTLTSTPMHIIFSTTMALVFAANRQKKSFGLSLFRAVVVASLMHALFDTLVFNLNPGLIVIYALIAFTIFWGKKVFLYALSTPRTVRICPNGWSIPHRPRKKTVSAAMPK